MRAFIPVLILVITAGFGLMSNGSAGSFSAAELLRVVREPNAFVKVTEEPYFVSDRFAQLCAPLSGNEKDVLDPHGNRWIDVFATAEGVEPLRRGSGEYATGTILLKEKRREEFGGKPDLMLKREPSYNSGCGDWEFFVLDGDGTKVIERGRIESCMDCHKGYAKTGFVARDYLATPDPSTSKQVN